MKESIKTIFLENFKANLNYKQIIKRLKIKKNNDAEKKHIQRILIQLAKENFLIEVYTGKYRLNPTEYNKSHLPRPVVEGIVDMKQTGKAYVITEEITEDIFISAVNTNKALHNDKVKVRLFPKRKNRKTEGEIIEILKRYKTSFVGKIELHKNFAFFIPDNKSVPIDIYIPKEELQGSLPNEKVIAEITEWPKEVKNPFGRIIKRLGKSGENDVEIHSILEEYNLPYTFSDRLNAEANKIETKIASPEIKKRSDFRSKLTFTIDPEDAKDFDDAISFYQKSENTYEIGIHIADVSHYIKQDGLLDKEAYKRATSVYLVDRVVPMLPENISNKVCSLRPDEEKLCYSVIFDTDLNYKFSNFRIKKTIIQSNKRFTYEEVQTILDKKEGIYYKELYFLNNLSQHLRKKRIQKGAIAFEKQEVRFILDKTGNPLGVEFKDNNESHQLIEELMLLANKTVAEKIGKQKSENKIKTFVYRVHDIPNPEKLNNLKEFVTNLGYKMNTESRKSMSKSFNALLKNSKGKGEENLIETLTLRSMAKAEYSTENIGHYGLAFDYYTHFTSPIRRYPDLMVHRFLDEYLKPKPKNFDTEEYEEKCKHSTDMEKRAQDAERESIKLKQVEFLSDKINNNYEGVISGVSKWGIFVEIIENKCEGMIRLKDLTDDYYYLDEENYQVIGNNTGIKYKLGDEITISIKSVNFQKKEIDFELA